jgi:sulfur relay (sulfurtransferase) DsrF/TusC family protein
MKQTAVEWYNEQLNLYGDMAFNKEISLSQYHIKKQELVEQAKEMEKENLESLKDFDTWKEWKNKSE